jgi:NAD(P)-dependent dehydrogenase (short-subunit alcohol dehydrogenase family)
MSAEKIVLITGASSGVGRATAHVLAERGYKVLGTSRNPDFSGAIPRVEMLKLDVRSDASVSACVDAAGPIDVLVNNAGYELAGAAEETSLEELTAQFETNFFGVARMVKAVLPMMRERKRGRIVNMSSLAGMAPAPFMSIYSASKFALEGYTAALRHEVLPFNIHVSLVEVGFLNTPMMEHRQVTRETIEDYTPWRRCAFDAIATAERQGPGPELVAQTIRVIVESRTPRLRYMTGRDANLVSRLQRWLPESAFEKGVRRTFGLDRPKH